MIEHETRSRAGEILDRLDPLYSDMATGLQYSTPLELLMATILSAQCTDERVNLVTPSLFARCQTVQDYAGIGQEELESIIHSCGFFRNKAKNIKRAAAMLLDRFGGQVPQTMEDLISLPGVARKTANVVLSHAFSKDEGIAVDTHVQRLSRRLGLSASSDPGRIEADLMAVYPVDSWGRVSDVLIWHGRRVCASRRPLCPQCSVADLCPSAGTAVVPQATLPLEERASS